jgi:enamine deaminase RidA (YjgF/YER057c/UK114 family)
MTLERLQPPGWPRPRGYSNGFRVPAGHDLVFTGGMVGWDAEERMVEGGFVPQFEQALRNVVTVVAEAGGGPEDVVSMTVFVTGREDYLGSLDALGRVWRDVMGRNYPAMALIEIAGFVEEGARVEIQAVAALAPRSTE